VLPAERGVNGAGSSVVARPLARAAATRDVQRLLAHRDVARYGWTVEYDGDVLVTVGLQARTSQYPPDRADSYTLTLNCESYDAWPAETKFVNPETRTYVVGQDEKYLPIISGFPNFGLHARFDGFYDKSRVDQLICFSLTRGYYDSAHVPEPDQRWTPGRHWLYSTIKVLHRALSPAFYGGRLAAL
jgi:hypothetical protein